MVLSTFSSKMSLFKKRGDPSPQELAFWRVGTTEIEKYDFSSHDPGLLYVSFYITRVCRTRLDGSTPLKLCYMSRSRYNEIGPPTVLAKIYKISIFEKSWEWVGLVWKMLVGPVGVFLGYPQPPSAHLGQQKTKI